MPQHAVFIRHQTLPGQRDAVHAVWQRHMQPAIQANPEHAVYVYSFGTDPDQICAFQVYASREAAEAFLRTAAYRAYEQEVAALLLGPPVVEVLQPQWMKSPG